MSEAEKENKFLKILKLVGMAILKFLWAILKGIWNILVLLSSLDRGWQAVNFDEEVEEKKSLFLTKGGNIKLLLSLASVVIKADGNVQEKELDYIRRRISKDYNQRTSKLWMAVLTKELERNHDLANLCRKAESRFNRSTKIQLLYFLCGIVTRDGLLAEKEYEVLKQIGMRIRLPFQTLKSVLAMFDFITEAEAKSRQETKEKPKSPKWFLARAYDILEITASTSDKEVKKAFRKLASIHHPDKVSHMGESFRQAANRKFKELLQAYEVIKEDRGFV